MFIFHTISHLFTQCYLEPIRRTLYTHQPILTETLIHKIFHNVEFILSINSLFLQGLTERIEVQKSEIIGDIFLKAVCTVLIRLLWVYV